MLSKRIIPCLDVKEGRVVKGVRFVGLRDAGDPVEVARRYDAAGADEITLLDITASHEDRGTLLERRRAHGGDDLHAAHRRRGRPGPRPTSRPCSTPGADKVAINTAAVNDPALVRRASDRWGAQAIVVAIDARARADAGRVDRGDARGRRDTGLDAVAWAARSSATGPGRSS